MTYDSSSLPAIHSPADVKALALDQLPALAEKIRRTLISTLSETGGHLGPNLGVVELSIAMHRVFDTPKDKFIWDVAHQAYVHKMITGRWDRIHTIRQYEGLNGFALRTESEHDCYGAGHAGTALSAALGFAAGRDQRGSDDHVVCVAGDAAFTCGPSFEALNNVATHTKRLIIVLNDNEWSIDRNVGAVARIFNELATHPAYAALHQKTAEFLEKVGGKFVRRVAGKVEGSAKALVSGTFNPTPFTSAAFFEQFGVQYYGPIDGHDVGTLIKTFEFLKTMDRPVILHILTEKGKGYKPALDDPGKFHGLGKYNIETGETPSSSLPTYSQVYARSVTDFAKDDPKIMAITAAMPGGTGLGVFKKEIPERYYDVGIAEEHAALFACGLAAQGLKPFLTIYSTFMQRAFDMILHDMAIQNLPVRLCMDRGSLSGDDGPTHHGLFDISYLRAVPGLVHMQPKDEDEFVDMLWTMAHYEKGPIAIRYPRGNGPGAPIKEKPVMLEIGKSEVLAEGHDVVFIAIGDMLELAKAAKAELEAEGRSVGLINARWIKPLDAAAIEKAARGARVICTLEDHVLSNGFGCGIMEHLSSAGIPTPVVRIGWPDEFIEHGSVPVLRKKHGLTADNAVRLVRAKLG
jgi:1-deoxy-D-xylulose-5-phosphate synthase